MQASARPHYFRVNASTTAEELKRQYLQLAMQYHPDRGGTNEAMQAINAEYEELRRRYGHVHESASGATYEGETDDRPGEFAELIDFLIGLNLDIEVIGRFVWVTGDTYPHKDELKERGFRWSRNRKAWYYAAGKRSNYHSNLTMDEIRMMYGVRYSHEGGPASHRLSA